MSSARYRLGFAAAALLAFSAYGAKAPAADVTARVVSIGGGVTEIVYALNAQARLVGIDTSSTYPLAETKALPKVGYQRTLSAEGVLSLHPNLLLASHEAGPPTALQQIEAAGVHVVHVDGDYTFAGLTQRINTVGDALQVSDASRKLIARLSQQWEVLQASIAAKPPRNADGTPLRVAFVMSRSGSMLGAGRNSGADALLKLVGATNVFGDTFDDYKPVSAEALIAAAPDMIVTTVDGPDNGDAKQQFMAQPGVALTPAGKNGRVAVFDIVLLLGFGPRLPEAVGDLYRSFGS